MKIAAFQEFLARLATSRPERRIRRSLRRRVGVPSAIEGLEDRTLLSAITVNTTADTVDANPGDGFALDANGKTSLRAAIMEANALSGADTINLGSGTFALTIAGSLEDGALTGDLDITDDVTIIGAGANLTTIDARDIDRVFDVLNDQIGGDINLTLKDLTITGGRAVGDGSSSLDDKGGAIRTSFYTSLMISGSVFRGNEAPETATNTIFGAGGAISSDGDLTILDSRFEDNMAANSGGAIYIIGTGTTRIIRNSSFLNNSAPRGGAIYNHEKVTIENSTFSGNGNGSLNGGDGGAINNNGGGDLTLINSTISDNIAGFGGGIYNAETLTILNCTITANTSDFGGGISISSSGATVSVENTIIAGNTATFSGPDVYGTVNSGGHNLIGNPADSSGFRAAGDLLNVDPKLAALADNGGPTLTHALQAGSPAIDAANTASAPATDQRGVARPQGAAADIGAFELVAAVNQAPVAQDLTATIAEDTFLESRLSATDAEGDALIFAKATDPAHGLALVLADGKFRYFPDPNYFGTDSFTYTVSDGNGGTDTATVNVTINPVNDAPFVDAPTVTTNEDQAVSGRIDFIEVEGDPVTFSLVSGPANGTIDLKPDGSYTYTPDGDFHGTDSFTFRATDDKSASRDSVVTIEVAPVNDAPVAANDQFSVNEDQTLTITVAPASRLHMESEPGDFVGDGRTWDFTAANATFDGERNFDNGVSVTVDGTTFWSLDFAAPSEAELTPGRYTGAMRFSFQDADKPGLDVSGDGRGHNTLTGEFIVYEVDFGMADATGEDIARFAASFVQQGTHSGGVVDPPLRGTIQFNTGVGAGGGVLANDRDVDGDLFTAALVDGPDNGSLTLNADGTFSYTPNANFTGIDTFTYKTNDGLADSNTATVSITVNPVNDLPVAVDDAYSVDEDGTLVVSGSSATVFDQQNVRTTGLYQFNAAFLDLQQQIRAGESGRLMSVDLFVGQFSDPGRVLSFFVNTGAAFQGDTPEFRTQRTLQSSDINGWITIDVSSANITLQKGDLFTIGAFSSGNPNVFLLATNSDFGGDSYAAGSLWVNGTRDTTPGGNDYDLLFRTRVDPDTQNGVLANDTDTDGDSLTATVVAGPAHGTLVLNADGSFTYTPDANYFGPDSFTYKANDGLADSNAATVSITVNSVNDLPTAQNGQVSTDEDSPYTFAVGDFRFSDADGDALAKVRIESLPTSGRLQLDGTDVALSQEIQAADIAAGRLTYTPDADDNGTDRFIFRVHDGTTFSAISTPMRIDIAAVNDAPLAVADAATTAEDAAVTIAVLANDLDAEGATLSVINRQSGPTNGTLKLNGDGTVTYTPKPNFHGQDSFTYRTSDGQLPSNTATVTILVTAVNDAPTVVNAIADVTVNEDAANSTIDLSNIFADVDIVTNGDSLTLSVANNNGGLVSAGLSGPMLTLDYQLDQNGSAIITVTATDRAGTNVSESFNVTVNAVNDAPVATDDSAATDEDNAVVINVLGNDSDIDGNTLTVISVTDPNGGTAAITTNGTTVTFTPDADFNSATPTRLQYTISDGNGQTDMAVVAITVNAVNDPPVNTVPGGQTTIEDTALVFSAAAGNRISVNDVDAGTQPLEVTLSVGDGVLDLSGTAGLTFTAGDGSADATMTFTGTAAAINAALDGLTYQSAADFNGSATLTIVTGDQGHAGSGGALSDTDTVSITVSPANDAPTITAIADQTIDEDTPSGAIAFTIGDVETAAGSLVVTAASSNDALVPDGNLALAGSGADRTIVVIPAANQSGTATITVSVNDGTTISTETFTITVNQVNDAPTVVNAIADVTVNEDAANSTINLSNVFADVDVASSGDALTLSVANSKGSLVTAGLSGATLTLDYQPDQNGTATITVTATDKAGANISESFTVTVNQVNDPPVAADDSAATDEDAAVTIDVLGNDSDIDGDSLSVASVSQGANGSVSISGGSVIYSPNPNFHGSDSFTYQVSDGKGGQATATVTLTVNPGNDAPVAQPDRFTTAEDVPLLGNVLADNGSGADSDVDGDSLTATLVSGPANGSLTLNPDGSFTYTPRADFHGSDSFSYQASDGILTSNPATVTITVHPAVGDVAIDILRGRSPNRININSRGKIAVAILSTATFDAALDVDVESLRFGRTGSEDSLSRRGNGRPHVQVRDVNGDGLDDLVVFFEIRETDFTVGDTQGVLTGRTHDGVNLEGRDAIDVHSPRGQDDCRQSLEDLDRFFRNWDWDRDDNHHDHHGHHDRDDHRGHHDHHDRDDHHDWGGHHGWDGHHGRGDRD